MALFRNGLLVELDTMKNKHQLVFVKTDWEFKVLLNAGAEEGGCAEDGGFWVRFRGKVEGPNIEQTSRLTVEALRLVLKNYEPDALAETKLELERARMEREDFRPPQSSPMTRGSRGAPSPISSPRNLKPSAASVGTLPG